MTAAQGERVLSETRAWVQTFVIGLNLCPFAKAPQIKGLVRYVLCEAQDPEGLLQALVQELKHLSAAPADEVETTLLVHPQVLTDFADYNDFLDVADDAVAELELEGVLQVASFHPQYQFAGTRRQDVGNATNQSPYPMLHLLREASIERAITAPEQADRIIAANAATLEALGEEGVQCLRQQCRDAAAAG